MLLHRRNRHHPAMRILQVPAGFLRCHGTCLEQQDAGDDLQAVGYAMLHFLQQDLLLAEQVLGLLQENGLLPLDRAALGDIHEGEQNG